MRASSSSNDGKNDEADSTKDPPPARENSPKSSQTGAIKGNTPNQAGSKVTDPVLQSTGVEKPKVVVQGEATQGILFTPIPFSSIALYTCSINIWGKSAECAIRPPLKCIEKERFQTEFRAEMNF